MKRTAKVSVTNPGGNASKGSLRYTLTIPPIMMQELGITLEDRDLILTLEDHKITIEKGEKEMEIKRFTGIKQAVGHFNNHQGHAEIMLDKESGKVWCDVFASGQEWKEYHDKNVVRLLTKAINSMWERDDTTSMREINEKAEESMKSK